MSCTTNDSNSVILPNLPQCIQAESSVNPTQVGKQLSSFDRDVIYGLPDPDDLPTEAACGVCYACYNMKHKCQQPSQEAYFAYHSWHSSIHNYIEESEGHHECHGCESGVDCDAAHRDENGNYYIGCYSRIR